MAHPIEVGKSVSIIDANSTNIWPITSTNNIFYVIPAQTLDNPENMEYAGEYVNPVTGNMIVYSYDTSTQNNSVFRNYICKGYSDKHYPDSSIQLNTDTDINDPAKSQIYPLENVCDYGVVTRIENMQYGKDSSIQLPTTEGVKFPAPNQKTSIMNVHITPLEKLMRNVINTGNLDENIVDSIEFNYDNLKFIGDVSTSKKVVTTTTGRNKVSVTVDVSVIRLRDSVNPKNGNKIEVNDGNISILTNNAGTRVFKTKNYQYSSSSYTIGQINTRYRPLWQEGVTETQYNIAYIEDLRDEHNYLQSQINEITGAGYITVGAEVAAGTNINVAVSTPTAGIKRYTVSTTDDITVNNLTVNNIGTFNNNVSVKHNLQNGLPYFSIENNEYINNSETSQKNIYGSSNVNSAVLNELTLYNPIRISANSRMLFSGQWPSGNNAAWPGRSPINIEWDVPSSKIGGRNYWGKSPKDGKSIIVNPDGNNAANGPDLSYLKYWNHGTFPVISSQAGRNDSMWIDLSTYKEASNGNPYMDLRLNAGDDGVQRIIARQTTYYEVFNSPGVSNMTRKDAFAKVMRDRFFSREYPSDSKHAWFIIEVLDSNCTYNPNNNDWYNKKYITSSFGTIPTESYTNNINTLAQIREDDIKAVCRLPLHSSTGYPNTSSLSGTIFNNSWFNSTVGNECYRIYTASSEQADTGTSASNNPGTWILSCVINPCIGDKEFANTGAEAVLLDDKHNTQFPGTVTCKKLETDEFSLNGDPNRFMLGNGISGSNIPLRTELKISNNTFTSTSNANWKNNGYYLSDINIPSTNNTLTLYNISYSNNSTPGILNVVKATTSTNADKYEFKYRTIGGFIHILHVDITYPSSATYGGSGILGNNVQSTLGKFYKFSDNSNSFKNWLPEKPPYKINQAVISTNNEDWDVYDSAQFGIVYTLTPDGDFGIERWYHANALHTREAHLDFIWIS